MSDMVPKDPDANGFLDNEAIRELTDKVVDELRPLGITVDRESIHFVVHPEFGMQIMIPGLVRPSAKQKMDDDRETREAFSKMMADQNEAMVEDKKEEIEAMLNADNFEDLLFGDAEVESSCSHERRHPSTNHCLDCGEGMEE